MQKTSDYAEVANEARTEYLFDPDKFSHKDPTLTTDNHMLSEAELKKYGILASTLRKQFRDRSSKLKEAAVE